jgi:hypothetical protein
MVGIPTSGKLDVSIQRRSLSTVQNNDSYKPDPMKNLKAFLLVTLCTFVNFSCDDETKETASITASTIEESYDHWLHFKEDSGNSYKYTLTHSSWTGIRSKTVVSVENGEVVQRNFQYTTIPEGSEIANEELEWTEDAPNEIGTHQGPAGEPLTMDEIYEKAKQEWLVPREGVKTYFEGTNQGLISVCGYVHEDCIDDCFVGVHIESIEEL